VFAITRLSAFGRQAFLKVERRYFAGGARTASSTKISTVVGAQACISVPPAAKAPAAVNASSQKTQRILCSCWDERVFGQALNTNV
jgi:hypothetical protein